MKTIPLCLVISTIFLSAHDAFAESRLERITLMLKGPGCEAFHQNLETTLGRLEGVRAVDRHSVPGHLLIDIESRRVTGEELAQRVTKMATDDQPCRAAVMESCITAGHIKLK